MLSEKFKIFEDLIQSYIIDTNATIKDCQLEENNLGIYLLINYAITDKYMKENDLYYKNRTMKILIKRKEGNEGAPISSHATPEV